MAAYTAMYVFPITVCSIPRSSSGGGYVAAALASNRSRLDCSVFGRVHGGRCVTCVASTNTAVEAKTAQSGGEATLVEALLGIQGRGRTASAQQLQEVAEAVRVLEEDGGVRNPTSSPLIEGRWQLMYTTRPSTASLIQRTFVGVDAVTVFQEITLTNTDNPRVSNIVRFSETIGELKVEAAASVENEIRILFRFDRAAFSFKILPFKVPYPVPFQLLGDEAKGWLDTTYLSPKGTLRIARGNKGTTFVLQKNLDPRQTLLRAISSGQDVEKVIDQLVLLNPTKIPTDLSVLAGTWRLVWSSQASSANWIQQISAGFQNWQIIYESNGRQENLVEFLPWLRLRAGAQTTASSDERTEVIIEGAAIELGGLKLPIRITGEGFVDVLYLDSKLKISRGNRGSVFVHIRESELV